MADPNPIDPMIQQTVQGVTQQGGNFLMDLITSPFKALGNMAKGALNGTLKTGIWGAGLAIGLTCLAPDLLHGILHAVGLDSVNTQLQNLNRMGGFPAVAMAAGATGLAGSAALGGVQSLLSSFSGGRDGGGGLGTAIGTGLVIATVAAVTIGAVNAHSQQAENDPPAPPPTPPGTPRPPARGR